MVEQTPPSGDALCLVGDIGGTNSRFGLVRAGSAAPEAVQSLGNDRFASLEAAIRAYLAEHETRPKRAAIAVAGPVVGDEVSLTNRDWTFSRSAMAKSLAIEDLQLINDFEAQALSLPCLAPDDLQLIGRGEAKEGAPKVVLGPGTGLGVGMMVPTGSGLRAIATEGGHVELPVADDLEFRIKNMITEQFGRCSMEHVISGPGLQRIYECLCRIEGQNVRFFYPSQISAAAGGDQPDALASRTIALFCTWLGRFAGDAALMIGAEGGVYLAGGVSGHLSHHLESGAFREAFEAKASHRSYVEAIPTFRVKSGISGLIGAAAALGGGRR